jgi:hypoxanthine phosphoribosyltransferase
MKQQRLTWRDVEQQVQELLRQMHQQQWKPDYVVGLTRGGLTPAVMISQYLNVPMHSLKVSLRHGGEDCESNLWMAEEAFGYDDQDPARILIVDDINDSGATMKWIRQDWQSGCLPNDERWNTIWNDTVRFAVLVNNSASQYQQVDYTAVEINKNDEPQWIVFPWEEWWR